MSRILPSERVQSETKIFEIQQKYYFSYLLVQVISIYFPNVFVLFCFRMASSPNENNRNLFILFVKQNNSKFVIFTKFSS